MFKKLKLAKDGRWLLLACIGVGALIAFPVVAQFFAVNLLEPVASLWGSALGAWAGIAGALWVAERQAATQRRAAATLVRQMFYPVAFALDELALVYGPPSRPNRGEDDDEPDVFSIEKWKEIADHAQLVLDQYKKFNNRIHRYEAGLNLLSATSLNAALDLETELADAIDDSIKRLIHRPKAAHDYLRDIVTYKAQSPSWSSQFALHVFNQHVQQYMAQLERDAT